MSNLGVTCDSAQEMRAFRPAVMSVCPCYPTLNPNPVMRRQDMEKYGPGKVRSMEEWTEWSGVNFKDTSSVSAGDKFCKEDIPIDRSRMCPVSPKAKAVFDLASTAAQ